jgi:tetratricopeptide (TPR) repeat protein
MLISACLIVKDGAATLERCLKSLAPIAEEIIVVDTGSKDTSIEIAKSHGAQILSFDWCDDFASARNLSIASAKGDWVLILDADEWLSEETVSELPEILSEPLFSGPVVLNGRVGPPEQPAVFKRLLFRNHQGLTFSGRVHETLVLPEDEPKRFDCFPLRVYHQPISKSEAKSKALWYLSLLKIEFQQTGLTWSRQAELWQHRAEAYLTLGQNTEAQQALLSAWNCYQQADLPREDLFGTLLLGKLVMAELELQSPDLWDHIQILLQRAPERFEAWFFQAYVLLNEGHSQTGMAYLKEALLRRKELAPVWQFRLDLLLGRYSLLQGAIDQGQDLLFRLFALSPQPELAWHCLRAGLLSGINLEREMNALWQFLGESPANVPRQQAQRLLREPLWSPEERKSLQLLAKGFRG